MTNQKLSVIGMTAFAAMTLYTHPVKAEEFAFKPYVGIDLMRMNADYNSNYDAGGGLILDGDTLLEDSLDGFNIHVGNRFHKNFGLELGYFRTREEEKDIANGTTVGPASVATADFTTAIKAQGLTLDGLGYIPVTDDGRLELIGTAGLSWMSAETEVIVPGVGSGSEDDNEFGFRVGAGAQYGITDRVNIRGLVRYDSADFENIVDSLWTYSLGVNYSF